MMNTCLLMNAKIVKDNIMATKMGTQIVPILIIYCIFANILG
jgi:hypothetical protein